MPSKSIAEICELLAAQLDGQQAIASGQSYMPLLPLLEHPLPDVRRHLHSCLTAANIPSEIISAASPEKLVLFALGSWGSHWPELGIQWLESGMQTNGELAQALERISQDTSLPQSLRHRAFALEKAWRRINQAQATVTPNPSFNGTPNGAR